MVASGDVATSVSSDGFDAGRVYRFGDDKDLGARQGAGAHRPTGMGAFFKRAEDLFIALSLLLFISPIMVVIAIAIKSDSHGPVLFWQRRRGLAGKTIWICKFRTMTSETEDEACERQTSPNDPRVTKVGHILRRHSLDELPQLINVLRGEMSLVGPRPHAMLTCVDGRPLASVTRSYRRRYAVKPGITGWAQVNGFRGELDTTEKLLHRIEYDLYYIENWSVVFDIEILIRTVGCVFKDKQAF